ncbi:NfeD family protein [Aureibacter tunicatorum]|uniref:Membrane-bound ClpP family serine protease n=1 Tax=Aureibacter tunicatorum TaxID=866807 RepID=A0AAE3XKU2_9BACT|nr:NfeD family protein [Aureibacter tunicatorum]MDR6237839.1 membrane-bound ClpP family serine protease [Aureibacter tunicatorum]BDD02874.1 hypothetical protein AUTU_03570 [Aureibacter tunicatorum]
MDWLIIFFLIAIGLFLIIAEIIFIPGTTFVGLLGFALSVAGIIVSYKILGSTVGNYVLAGTLVLNLTAIYFSFKSGVWNKFALHKSNPAKVNKIETHELEIGQSGICLSDMKPIGNIEIEGKRFEARTKGEFLDSGTKIKIIRFDKHKIIVEQINN